MISAASNPSEIAFNVDIPLGSSYLSFEQIYNDIEWNKIQPRI